MEMSIIDDLKQWYKEHQQEILKKYFAFLEMPSISTDPAYQSELVKTAEWLREHLEELGFKSVIWDASGSHPTVFATHYVDASCSTVLFYHHYDVQPVDPIDQWISPPFKPTLREGKVYARGASDNKGQCYYTLTAFRAVLQLYKMLRVNIKIVIEGGEESGSRGLLPLLTKKKEDLKADHLLVVDLNIPAPNTPSITLGLRGIVSIEVRCSNARIDLHSGIYGGIVSNPNHTLIQMLAQLWDREGKINIPHFYDTVMLPSKKELAELYQKVEEEHLVQQFGITSLQKGREHSLWELNTIFPTLEINGLSGGYQGAGFKTIIPAMAMVKLSLRLVPQQNPQQIANLVVEYLKKIAPPGIKLEFSIEEGGEAVRFSSGSKIAQICAKAYESVFNKPCQRSLSGASVPLVARLVNTVGAETAMIGVALDTDDIHAPNEHFSLQQLEQGFLLIGTILKLLET